MGLDIAFQVSEKVPKSLRGTRSLATARDRLRNPEIPEQKRDCFALRARK